MSAHILIQTETTLPHTIEVDENYKILYNNFMTSEIARQQDSTPSYWLIERGITGTDLTLIYNTHATPEQAAESTSYIESDSVVFLEGFGGEPGIQRWYEDDINLFNSIRLKYGKDSEQYRIVKDMFLDHLEQFEHQPSGPTD